MRWAALVLLAATSCQPPSSTPEDPLAGVTIGESALEASRAACLRDGGRFSKGPAPDTFVCFRTPRDAGKYCRASTDCSTECLARSRTCAPVTPLLGCNEVLTENGGRVTLCKE